MRQNEMERGGKKIATEMEFHLSSSTFRFLPHDTIVLATIELSQPKTDTFIGLNTIIFSLLCLWRKKI